MRTGVLRHVDLLAAAAAAAAAAMAVVYVAVAHAQGDTPLAWVLAVLVAAAVANAYGAARTAPRRARVLLVAGIALVLLGWLAILTIGIPILASGALAIVASFRARAAG
jgi:hypothetical protein